MRIGYLFALVFFLSLESLVAQEDTSRLNIVEGKLPGAIVFDFGYAFEWPEFNMREDFLNNYALLGNISYLSPKAWGFGFTAQYQFQENVRTDVLAPLRTSNGFIIDRQGSLAEVELGQRGVYLAARFSKLLPLLKKYKRSGIEVAWSLGYWQHWIRLNVQSDELVQFTSAYKRGFDRMTTGFAMQQFLGYRHYGKKKFFNAFIGLELTEGFTQNRRSWNYDTLEADKRKHFDVLYGFRIGISLPVYIYTLESVNLDGTVDFY